MHGCAVLAFLGQPGSQGCGGRKTVARVARRPWKLKQSPFGLLLKFICDAACKLVLSGLLAVTAEHAGMADSSPMPTKSVIVCAGRVWDPWGRPSWLDSFCSGHRPCNLQFPSVHLVLAVSMCRSGTIMPLYCLQASRHRWQE